MVAARLLARSGACPLGTANIAQLVEQLIRNQQVPGSSPGVGSGISDCGGWVSTGVSSVVVADTTLMDAGDQTEVSAIIQNRRLPRYHRFQLRLDRQRQLGQCRPIVHGIHCRREVAVC